MPKRRKHSWGGEWHQLRLEGDQTEAWERVQSLLCGSREHAQGILIVETRSENRILVVENRMILKLHMPWEPWNVLGQEMDIIGSVVGNNV